jgi:hypothetical protein
MQLLSLLIFVLIQLIYGIFDLVISTREDLKTFKVYLKVWIHSMRIPSPHVNVVLKVNKILHHFPKWELQGQLKYLGWFIQIYMDHYKPTHILVASISSPLLMTFQDIPLFT